MMQDALLIRSETPADIVAMPGNPLEDITVLRVTVRGRKGRRPVRHE